MAAQENALSLREQVELQRYPEVRSSGETRRSALLLGGTYSGHGSSMLRYGLELRQALRATLHDDWRFEDFNARPTWVARSLEETFGARASSVLVRYLEYPIKASRLNADVFHVLDHGFSHLLLALDPRRSVVTCHDVIPLLISRGILDIPMDSHIGWTFLLRVRLMKRAAYVIAVSESTRRDVVKYLGIDPERVITIAVGVSSTFCPTPDPEGSSRLRGQLGIPQDSKVVLTVSASADYKNISSILRAMHVLKRQMSSRVIFLRVGGDFSRKERELIKELEVEDCVQYAGRPETDEDLARFYRLADVFAFPSSYEGFGWPPLEAMRCGTPVVASNAGSLPEVLGEAALFVDPTDVPDLAGAIGRLMQDESLRAEMVARGLKRAACYTWERTAEQTIDVYKRIIRQCAESNS
jgi:glycosyltransferase involved in cell wall biosynthesis